MSRRFQIRALPLLGALFFFACGSPPAEKRPAAERLAGGSGSATPARIAVDLVKELPVAVARREVAVFDLGDAAVRPHLITGWGNDESDPDGSWVWGLGKSSELQFFAAAPADVTLVLRARKLVYEGAPRQRVTVSLNGREIAEVEIGDEIERHRIPLPADAVRRGTNNLRFGYRHHRSPREVLPGSRDERPLAVRWYEIGLEGLGSEAPPRLEESGGGRLVLPAGSQISYHFDFEPGDELVIGGFEARGSRDGVRLLVETETADGMDQRHVDPATAPLPLRLPLPAAARSLGRLTLCAVRSAPIGPLRRGWRSLFGGSDELTLLLPMVMTSAAPEAPPEPLAGERVSRPNVLIYLIDTLRADHLGLYGYSRETSPNLDRFARDAVVFQNAWAQSSWTRSAVVSMMTGLLPQVHGVNRRDEALGRGVDTLAEILAGAGYHATGFITNGNVSGELGLGQGFDGYHYLWESDAEVEYHQLSDRLNRHLFGWLEERATPPFFLYAHATDPHSPYTPREPFRSRFAPDVDPEIGWIANVHGISSGQRPATDGTAAAFRDLYDGEIAFNDHHFGRLIERLKALGLYDSMLIVVLSDHGEEFAEHGGWEHGKTLYGEQLRIPLLLKLPGGTGAGLEIDVSADQVDVLPTILDYLGIEPPPRLDGRSLLPLLGAAGSASNDKPSYAYLGLDVKNMRSVTARGWRLIVDHSRQRRGQAVELYRLAGDPLEHRELYNTWPLERGFLEQTLNRLELSLRRGTRPAAVEQIELSDELRRRLEALGYVN